MLIADHSSPWTYEGAPFRNDGTAYGFVYMLHFPNGKRYIGRKKFNKGWENYFSSSEIVRNHILKAGHEGIVREVIYVCETMQEAVDKEDELLTEHDAASSDLYYNVRNTKNFISEDISTDAAEKIGKSLKGRYENDEEFRNRHIENNRKKANDPEIRKKISEANKKAWSDPENLEKLRKAQLRRFSDPEERKKQSDICNKRFKDPNERAKCASSDVPIRVFTVSGHKDYPNIKTATAYLGMNEKLIRRFIRGDDTEFLRRRHGVQRILKISSG